MTTGKTIRRTGALLIAAVLICTMIPIHSAMADQTGTVFGGWLILRSAPSFSGTIKSSYPTGTVVTITGTNGSWYAVKTPDGMTGYMLGSYLKVSGSSTPTGSTAWVTSTNGLNVRLRTGPGTGYTILASYAPGTKCTILTSGSNWCRIQIGSYTGYMMSRYLTNTDPGSGVTPAPAPAPTPGGYTVWVTSQNGKGVNLRSGPSKSYTAIGFYGVGTTATMISAGAQWSYIQIGARTGYMMSQFLTTVAPAPAPTPVPTPVGTAYVVSGNGKSVNLRTGPGKGFKVIRSYAVGTPLTIVTKGAEWYFVHIGDVYGYMMRTFIAESPAPVPPPPPATNTDLT